MAALARLSSRRSSPSPLSRPLPPSEPASHPAAWSPPFAHSLARSRDSLQSAETMSRGARQRSSNADEDPFERITCKFNAIRCCCCCWPMDLTIVNAGSRQCANAIAEGAKSARRLSTRTRSLASAHALALNAARLVFLLLVAVDLARDSRRVVRALSPSDH